MTAFVAWSYLFDPVDHLFLCLLEGSLGCLVLLYEFVSRFPQLRQQLLHPALQLRKQEVCDASKTCLTTREPEDTAGLTCCAGWYLRQEYSDVNDNQTVGVSQTRSSYSVSSSLRGKKSDIFPGKKA